MLIYKQNNWHRSEGKKIQILLSEYAISLSPYTHGISTISQDYINVYLNKGFRGTKTTTTTKESKTTIEHKCWTINTLYFPFIPFFKHEQLVTYPKTNTYPFRSSYTHWKIVKDLKTTLQRKISCLGDVLLRNYKNMGF